MTATQTTALENSASIGRRHALAEAVYTHTASDLRLIRTFYHFSFLTLKIIAIIWFVPFNIGTTLYRKGPDSVNLEKRWSPTSPDIGTSASSPAEACSRFYSFFFPLRIG